MRYGFVQKTEGDLSVITKENIDSFASLLLPDSAEAIRSGEPMLALGWIIDDTSVAAISGQLEGVTFYITSFYVAPGYRDKGIGTSLLNALEESASVRCVNYILDMTVTTEEHSALVDFLKSYGFEEKPDSLPLLYLTTLEEAAEGQLKKKEIKKSDNMKFFDESDSGLLRDAERYATASFAPIPEGGFFSGSVDQQVSMVYEENGAISAYIVVEKTNGGLSISGALNESGKPMVMLKLFSLSLQRAMDLYSGDMVLVIPVTDRTADGLVRFLIPDAKQIAKRFELAGR